MGQDFSQFIGHYADFPKKGIIFRDVLPILKKPDLFSNLVDEMSSSTMCKNSDAIIAIDARGFIFGTAIAIKLSKPIVLARKPGKLPGELLNKSYELEYGSNSLSIQSNSIKEYQSFVIVDDLLATGGTAKCVADLLYKAQKHINGLAVVIELTELKGKSILPFSVDSIVKY